MAELYLNDVKLDLKKGAAFPLTFQIADITEPSKRKGNKSKTITLPGTAVNEAFFFTVWLLSTTKEPGTSPSFMNFDPSIKAKATYYNDDGVLLFTGVGQLLQVIEDGDNREFELSLFGEITNYMAELGKIKLSSLPWSNYDHTLSVSNIAASWEGSIIKNGSAYSSATSGKWNGTGYLYGLIDYGFNRAVENEFFINEFVPQVFLYDIIMMGFEEIGVTVESDFLESVFFKKHLLAWEGGKIPEISQATATATSITTTQENTIAGGHVFLNSFEINAAQNPVYVGTANEFKFYYNLGFGWPYTGAVAGFNADVLTDPADQVLTDYPLKTKVQDSGIYTLSYSGNLSSIASIMQVKKEGQQVEINSYGFGTLRFEVRIFVKVNNVVVFNDIVIDQVYQTINSAGRNKVSAIDWSKTIPLETNDQIEIELGVLNKNCSGNFDPPTGAAYDNSVVFREKIDFYVAGTAPDFNITRESTSFTQGQQVKLALFMPNLSLGDTFKGIINAYNMYQDEVRGEDKTIKSEPLNDFYEGTDTAEKWSRKIDRKQEVNITPTSAKAAKNYIFKFKEAKDELSNRYLESTGRNYGEKILNSGVDFSTKDELIKLPFCIFPVAEVPNTSLIIPRVYKVNGSQTEPIKTGPSIVMAGYAPGIANQPPANWGIRDEDDLVTNFSRYPYVGHVDKPINGTADFSFSVPEFVFYSLASNETYPTNNLYLFVEKFLKELVDVYGKFLEAYFELYGLDINTLSFSKLKNIDGVIYRLQKISDFDSGNPNTTLCELIRVIEGDALPGGSISGGSVSLPSSLQSS